MIGRGRLVASLLAAVVTASAAQAADAFGEWIAREIKPLDWDYVGRSTARGLVLYAKEAPESNEPELHRIWARYEHRASAAVRGTRIRSSVALQEFDCESREGRTLESTYYVSNNLTGGSFKTGEEPWSMVQPGTAFELLLQHACAAHEH